MSISRGALLTFAFVSESLKTHHDLVVGLSPLFNPIASELSGEIFEQANLLEAYGQLHLDWSNGDRRDKLSGSSDGKLL